jgi:hypothetical protein
VPVDANLRSAADVPAESVDVQDVLAAFKAAGSRVNIVVLDACRDNPFGAVASAKGLAPMDAPPGTFLAFATAPGNVAEDGSIASGHGLYTQHLVQELSRPAAKIEDVFKRVRWQVREESQGRQVPWESTSLEDNFYFDPKLVSGKRSDEDRTRDAGAELERESAEWDRVKKSRAPDELYAFLEKYPDGLLSEQAQFRLDQLQQARIAAQTPIDRAADLRSGVNRYAVGDKFVQDDIDGFTGKTKRSVHVVTYADDDRVEINGGVDVLDQMGGTIRNNGGQKEPADLQVPADMSIGKHWRSAFTNTRSDGRKASTFYDSRVVAFEEVTVPAGRFMAFRVERSGVAVMEGLYNKRSDVIWVDPATMLPIRHDTLHRDQRGIRRYDSRVLVSLTRVPR